VQYSAKTLMLQLTKTNQPSPRFGAEVLDRPVPIRVTKPLPNDVSRPRLRDAVPEWIAVDGDVM
jgi:hypothetical protein